MAEAYSARFKDGWARFMKNLDHAFRFSKGSGGKLVRPRFPRKVAGVCSGLAEHFGWNVTLLRVLMVVLAVGSTGLMIVAYAAAWLLIPEGQYFLSDGSPRQAGTSPS